MNLNRFFVACLFAFCCTGSLCVDETDTVPGEHRFCCENEDCECPQSTGEN